MKAFTILFTSALRQRKGTYIGIALLALVVVAGLTSAMSARINTVGEYRNAVAEVGVADMQAWVMDASILIDDDAHAAFEDALRDLDHVESVDVEPLLLASPVTIDGVEVTQLAFQADDPDRPRYRVFDESGTAFVPFEPLDPGEVYVPISYRTTSASSVDVHVGSEISVGSDDVTRVVTVKGFVEEPLRGTSFTSPNMAFIHADDFDALRKGTEERLIDASADPTGAAMSDYLDSPLMIYDVFNMELDGSDEAASDVMRAIGEDDALSASVWLTLQASMMESATLVLVDVFMAALIAFAVILMLATLLIVGNAISSSIQLDYRTYGILKAQGMTGLAMASLVVSQYAFAALVGAVAGIVVSALVTPSIGAFFTPFTGLLGTGSVDIASALAVLAVVVAVVALFSAVKARRIARISPVRALNSGMPDVRFSNPFTHTIKGRALNWALAVRAVTSAPGHYVGSVVMVALLTTFLLLGVSLVSWARTGDLLTSFGYPSEDFSVTYESEQQRAEAEEKIAEISEIKNAFRMQNVYLHVDDIQISALSYDTPESFQGILEGRAPLYDNEVLFTHADEAMFDKTIGDTVEIRYSGSTQEFVVCGLFQTANDFGQSIGILRSGLERAAGDKGSGNASLIGMSDLTYNYKVADGEKAGEIAEMLKGTYDDVDVYLIEELISPTPDQVAALLTPMMLIIVAISLAVELIAAFMLTSRSFLRERTALGIYRSLGFSARQLRWQFGLRFLCVALVGALIGAMVALAFGDGVLGALFGLFGISEFDAPLGIPELVLACAFVSITFGLFSFLAAHKVSSVDTKELITE